MDLDTAADELYVTHPSDFVRLRSELAAEAQRSGDKALAAAIKKLHKPTLGAWLANLLAIGHRDQTAELFTLGDMLRHAQLNLAGPEMRTLGQERRDVIGTLVSEARDWARKQGQPVADDAARELEATLSAALADETAAEKLRSGRLTSALEHAGFGPLEFAPGDRVAPERDRRASRETRASSATTAARDSRLRQRREAAEQAVRDAQTAASDAAKALEALGQELGGLQRTHDERLSEVDELEKRLADAKTAAASSERDLHRAQRTYQDAERRVGNARDRVTHAEDEAHRLAEQ